MKTFLLLFSLVTTLHGAEYFASRRGDDNADGLSPQSAFATITKGVAALKPGDTLTILPGTWFEAVSACISGTPESPITIRAQRPGTVLLRGDVEAPAFRPAEDASRTYVADFKQRIEGIAERGAMCLYEPMTSIADVALTNASYFQDDASGRVYVHTSDSVSPGSHALAFSVTNGFGLLLTAPKGSRTVHDVVIDGLSFTGYQARDFPPEPGSRNRWGMAVINGERVTIRRCSSFLNSGGFFLLAPLHCLVEDCQAFGNVSRFQVVGNNILAWGVSDTTFRRNVVEAFSTSGSSAGDITFYGGSPYKDLSQLGVMEDNVAINAGIMIKGGADGSVQRGNTAVGSIAYYYQKPDSTNLLLRDFESARARETYADPLNRDFRLQSGAPGNAESASVFFVAPAGDDAASGASLKTAWRTLSHAAQVARPGDTIYITAGEYHETLAPAQSGTAVKPIHFLRRGRDRVVIDGQKSLAVGVNLSGRSHVIVDGFLICNFAQAGIKADHGDALRIENMFISGISGDGASLGEVKNLNFNHNLMRECGRADLRIENCPLATVTANIFDGCAGVRLQCDAASLADLWSDANAFPPASAPLIAAAGKTYESLIGWQHATGLDPSSTAATVAYRNPGAKDAAHDDFALSADSSLIGRGPMATAIGPFVRLHVDRPAPVEELTVHDVTDATATMEWWTPTHSSESTLEWGEDPSCPIKIASPAGIFHTVSRTNLKPGAKYYYRVTSAKPDAELIFAQSSINSAKSVSEAVSEPLAIQTAERPAPPRVFHVSVTGDDHHSGLSPSDALRTINRGVELARAGDTVMIHEGTYEETVLVHSSGSEKAPIVLRAAPGETVWMDGSARFRSTAFRILGKHYVQIDGLRFHHFRYAPDIAPIIQIHGGSHLTIQRCFHDGRETQGYVPAFVAAAYTEDLVLENDVLINGMGEGLTALRCPGIAVRHCVFYNNFIRALTVMQFEPKLQASISHNLICDTIPGKTNNALLRISPLDSLRSDHNVYFARIGSTERHLVETSNIGGKTVGFQGPGQYYGEKLMLADVQKLSSQEIDSRFGNPGIRVAPSLLSSGAKDIDWAKIELHREGAGFAPLDFSDFLCDTNNPLARAVDGEPAGLDPKAFSAPRR